MNTALVYTLLCALVVVVALIFYAIGRIVGYKRCHDKNYAKLEARLAMRANLPTTDNELLTLNEYQRKAMTTCMTSCNNFSYMMLNLVGEVGEFASKVAKAERKGEIKFTDFGDLASCVRYADTYEQLKEELKKEAGDILWQLSGLITVMRWNLADVAQQNLDKLASRKQRGVIDGNGDNR